MKTKCIKHRDFLDVEKCPQCQREEYIQREVLKRTLYLVREIDKLKKAIEKPME